MALDEAAVRDLLDDWSTAIPVVWSATQRDELATRLVAIAGQLVPRVVEDVPLPPEQVDRFLLARTTDNLDDWIIRAVRTTRAAIFPDDLGRTHSGEFALGLRTANASEIAALPHVDRATATAITRYVTQVGIAAVDDLDILPGVGPSRLRAIRTGTYLDRPLAMFLSPLLVALLERPSMGTYIRAVYEENLQFFFGDATLLARRPVTQTSPFERLVQFLDFALEQATRASSVAGSVCTSQVQQALARRDLMARLDATTVPVEAELLVDADYLPAVTHLLAAAATRISLMLFLGTATAGDAEHPGPQALIAALEDAADRGVMVRVILDRDDGTYRSSAINEPLVRRLRAKRIPVKLDDPDVLLHSKVVVVDGNAAVVGSHNWTLNAFEGMNELSVLITSTAVAAEFTDRFDDLWASL